MTQTHDLAILVFLLELERREEVVLLPEREGGEEVEKVSVEEGGMGRGRERTPLEELTPWMN
jgi:hypothetical protein